MKGPMYRNLLKGVLAGLQGTGMLDGKLFWGISWVVLDTEII